MGLFGGKKKFEGQTLAQLCETPAPGWSRSAPRSSSKSAPPRAH
jgi:hypothetical protein